MSRVPVTRIELPELESSYRNSRRHVQHIFGPRIVEWPGYANMQIFMLIRQLDGFDPLKITKLRANSNSKLELDVAQCLFVAIACYAIYWRAAYVGMVCGCPDREWEYTSCYSSYSSQSSFLIFWYNGILGCLHIASPQNFDLGRYF